MADFDFGAAADIIGSVGGTAAQIISGNAAADAQRDASRDALRLSERQFDRLSDLNQPFVDAGTEAINRLRDLVGGSLPLRETPGFDFRRQEGINARDRSAASRGRLFSGAQQRGIEEFGQNFATNEFNNEFNRLAALAGIGQVGTGNVGQGANVLSALGSQAVTNAGDARASGFANTGNAISGGINNLVSAIEGFR